MDAALMSVGYGGGFLADFDASDTGPTHVAGQPVRVNLGPVGALVDPPDVMHVPDHALAFIAALPALDPTPHEYLAQVRQTHMDPPFAHDLHVALVAGTLLSDADYSSLRADWIADRQAALAPDLAAARAAVLAAGGAVVEEGTLSPFIVFTANRATIDSLLTSAPFEALSIDAPPMTPQLDDGATLRALTKMHPYVTTGTDLNGDGTPELYRGQHSRVAIIETTDSPGIDTHPGFHAMAPAAGSSIPRNLRLVERISCRVGSGSTPCADGEDAPGPSGLDVITHGTQVASVLVGDLMQGQDPNEAAQDWPLASFQSPEARFDYAWFKQPNPKRDERAHKRLIEHLASKPSVYRYTNHSYGAMRGCRGRDPVSRDLDLLFETGILPVAAAGNDGERTDLPCTVGAPSDSFGALTVAATALGGRAVYSSFPDPSIDGRVLLDVAAPGQYDWTYFRDLPLPTPQAGYVEGGTLTLAQAFLYPLHPDNGEACNLRDDNGDGLIDEGWDTWPWPGHPWCEEMEIKGTSYAAPAVTGALVNYREFYLNKYSRLIEDPGIAMVNALVRGDGRGATGIGLSTDLGAGILEMSMTHTPYLTPSWGWGTGRVCVRDNQDVLLPIRDDMPGDVERLRAVAWWYDQHNRRRHIDLAILEDGVVKGQDTSDDVKKRVHLRYGSEIEAGADYQLRLRGRDIRGSDPQCGSRQRLVYWAYLYADEGGS